jgi:uncharacterized protein (UPF0548 family)
MWTSLLERVTKLAGGRMSGGVEIRTRRVERGLGTGPFYSARRARRGLERLAKLEVNFAPEEAEAAVSEEGWRRDDERQGLPSEPPGAPIPGGSWEAARRVVAAYEFPDPAIVRAVHRPNAPLLGRDMLLELRYLGLRLHGGVRVDRVEEDTRIFEGRQARVWGWSYVTLEGHPEAGRRAYEVWKWLDTGAVEFRTHAVSRAASRNPLVRLAFGLLGRRRQRLFVRRACDRAALLTALELESGTGAPEPVTSGDGLEGRPTTHTQAGGKQLCGGDAN